MQLQAGDLIVLQLDLKCPGAVIALHRINGVVIDKIAGGVQDQPAFENFDTAANMGRMAEDHVRARPDQAVGECGVLDWRMSAPVPAPVRGHDQQINLTAHFADLVEQSGSAVVMCCDGHVKDAGMILTGFPCRLVVSE